MFKRKKKKVKETKGIKSTPAKEKKFIADEIIDAIPDAIIVLDLNGVIVSVNPAHAKMLGGKPEEIVGKSFDELGEYIKVEDIEKFMKLLGELIETCYVEPVETIIRTKNGREIPTSVTYSLIKDTEDNPEYIIASIRDISELKRAQNEVVTAKDYADNIIKSMIDTLIVVDPDGKIKTINKATSDLLGYSEDELIGKPVEKIFTAAEKKEEVSMFKGNRLKKLMKEGTVRDYNMKYRTKKGDVIPVSFSGSVMRNKDGNLVGIVGIARDMREIKRLMQKEKELAVQAAAAETDRKRAAELEKAYKELRNTQEKLVQSEKMATVGRLAAGVAHEINNPLAIILLVEQSISGMLKKQVADIPDSKVYLGNLERVERAANRCKKIVSNLLAFSRSINLQLASIDINKVVEETLESLEDQIKSRDISVVKNFVHLPTIKANKEQLKQVFDNLIMNACEVMSKGGQLRITTRLQERGIKALGEAMVEEGRTVEIEFSDTGEGIPEGNLLKIFDPFFTTKETGKGVGLGLYLSYGIIEQHGGTIEVTSGEGKGTTFIVKLPAKV